MRRPFTLSGILLAAMISSVHAAELKEGLSLLRAKQYAAANVIFQENARAGDPQAMYMLGRSLIRGWGVKKNPASALHWLRKAYQKTSRIKGKAAYEVGRIYQVHPEFRDYAKAIEWFWLSLEDGYGKGHVQLADLFARGLGTKVNKKNALFHLYRAAKLGYPQSMLAYARHMKAGDYGPADKREIDIWVARAVKILKRQSEKGSSTASVRLGKLYLEGDITQKNPALARKWFELGKRQGNLLAVRYLAKIDR